VEQRPYIVLGTEIEAAAHTRLSAAHELGHMVVHRHIKANAMRQTQAFKAMEAQAFRFAGAFLLPAEAFVASFQIAIAGLISLKYEWNVPVAAMIMRASQLGLLSEVEEKRLWRNYARRGYRKREPLDDEVASEHPAVLEQAIQLLVGEGVQSRDQICAAVPLAPSEMEALAGLPEGFLSRKPQVHLRGVRGASRRLEASSAPGSTVIPFPSRPNE
uniref:ImmA/IrrE family metallo-endopeptidase n=1 Tax=Candidatus Entotheonella palauensis TaxID=93172 RepID=UPI0015C46269